MNSNRYRLKLTALVVTLLVASLPAFAQYRWVDSAGRVNYGDAPPPDAKNLSRMDGRPATDPGAAAGGMPFELRKAMQTFPVTLYTALDCGPCESARTWLRQRNVPYQEIVVDTDVDAEELKRRVGTTSVPVMTLGRTPHLGFKEAAWSLAMSAAGYPAQIVLPPTYRAPPPQPIFPQDIAGRPVPANPPAPKS